MTDEPPERTDKQTSARALTKLRLRNMRRSPETVEVDPDALVMPDFEEDPRFGSLYTEVLLGQRDVAYTRMPREVIQCGFSRRTPDGRMEAVDSPPSPPAHVEYMVGRIREGYRPALHLYPGGHEPGRTHVCSDCASLRAYEQLDISIVPAILLEFTPQTLRYPALIYKNVDTSSKEGTVEIFDSVQEPATHPGVPRLHPDPIPAGDATHVLDELAERLASSLQRLRRFHKVGGEVHYHETLGSVLVRAVRIVRAIQAIVVRQPEQALTLLRGLYELSLNLHLDWLAPQKIGPIFLFHGQGTGAGMTNSGMNNATTQVESKRVAAGWNPAVAKDSARGMRSLLDLVQKADRKASIFPLGVHHKGIYATLSHQSHQDFVAGERFLHVLDSELDAEELRYPRAETDAAMTLQLADCFVALICVCAESDIGTADERE